MPSSSLSLQTLVPNLCPEAALLLACLHPHQTAKTRVHIKVLLQRSLDWQYFLQIVEKHRVLPSIYRNLPISSLPNHIQKTLRRRFYENAQRNLRLTQELMQLLDVFKSHKVDVIPYKGTVLSASAYGKLSLRQVWDIDILVREKDVAKSRELLFSSGFHQTESFDREQSFFNEERDVEVDLHWGLTPFYFPIDLAFEDLWQERQPVALQRGPVNGSGNASGNGSVMSFSSEHMLLILCIQIAKDCWERRQHIEHLAKVSDIAALIHTSPDLDWQAVLAQAQSAGIERILYFGLQLAQSLLDAPLPKTVEANMRGDRPPIRNIAHPVKQVCQNLFGTFDDAFVEANSTYLDITARAKQLNFYLQLRERPQDKIKHVQEIFKTIPTAITSTATSQQQSAE